jgi:hypothetical protein
MFKLLLIFLLITISKSQYVVNKRYEDTSCTNVIMTSTKGYPYCMNEIANNLGYKSIKYELEETANDYKVKESKYTDLDCKTKSNITASLTDVDLTCKNNVKQEVVDSINNLCSDLVYAKYTSADCKDGTIWSQQFFKIDECIKNNAMSAKVLKNGTKHSMEYYNSDNCTGNTINVEHYGYSNCDKIDEYSSEEVYECPKAGTPSPNNGVRQNINFILIMSVLFFSI